MFFLAGPTAVGKSALAVEVALLCNAEIVGADAFQVYEGLDLLTAKPEPALQALVPHHLIGEVPLERKFDVAQYRELALERVREIEGRGKRALVVGGTGLYGRAVLDNFDIPSQYPHLRAQLDAQAEHGLSDLYAQLVALDPLAASRMEPTNARRVVRALEVTLGSGRAFSSYGAGLRTYGPVRVVQVGIRCDFATLDERITSRFHSWLEDGLVDEVEGLARTPGGLSRTARQAVGYRELLRHVEGGEPLEECVNDAIAQSRRLARRQRSWFQRDPRIEWFDEPEAAAQRLHDVLGSPDGFVRD